MKRIISFILIFTLLSVSVFANSLREDNVIENPFSDISDHWANSEILKAYNRNVINGNGDGTFSPDKSVTRAEFMKMVTALLAENFDAEIQEFENSQHWADKFYYFAINNYLFADTSYNQDGIYPGVMRVENYDMPIKRWEMAYILFNALANVYSVHNLYNLDQNEITINDKDVISSEYHPNIVDSINWLVFLEIIKGDENGNFNAGQTGTKAQAAALINRSADTMDLIAAYYDALKAQMEQNSITYTDIPKGNPIVRFVMENNKSFEITLYPEYAPQTCANFITLVKKGFYDGLTFHRIINDFIIQGGDPLGNGTGGSGDTIFGEFAANGFLENQLNHELGVISMARSNINNSASSQFFICLGNGTHLDGQYAAFGKVTKGINVVKEIGNAEVKIDDISGENSSPVKPVKIKKVTIIK